MANNTGLDWPDYWRSLDDEGARALAAWLAAEQLALGEFMEVVDQAYAAVADAPHERSRRFVIQIGRPIAEAYARRKHQFGGLMVAFQEALVSGALPGTVAPNQLRPSHIPPRHIRPVAELLAAIANARGGRN